MCTFDISHFMPRIKDGKASICSKAPKERYYENVHLFLNRPPSLGKRLEGEHHPSALTPGSQDGNSTSPPLGGGGGGLQGGQGIQGGRRNSALGSLEGIQMNASLVRHPFASLQAN